MHSGVAEHDVDVDDASNRATTMRRFLAITLICLLVLGCTAGPAGPVPGGTGDEAAETLGFELPELRRAELEPSRARVRVVNAYAPLNGDPGPIDIFSGYSAEDGQQPLATVDYGTASAWFDPGVDSEGNAALSSYPSGRTSDDDKLGDQAER